MIVRRVNLEICWSCNATCSDCLRQTLSFPIPNFFLSRSTVSNLWKELPHLTHINFQGNFSDSPIHPEFLDILRDIVDHYGSRIKIQINTNASYKTTAFWSEIAHIIKNNRHEVFFDLDGIDQESHAAYRSNTHYDKVIENARAFIDAGGYATWFMLPLEHNKHLADQAKQLAEQYGFARFYNGKTARVFTQAMLAVHDNSKSATNQDLIKKAIKSIDFKGSKEEFLKDQKVSYCPWAKQGKIQVSGNGTVWPCCFVDGRINVPNNKSDKQHWDNMFEYDENWNSINHNSISDILKHPFFNHELEDSLRENPLPVCVEKCNDTFGDVVERSRRK